MTRKLEVEGLLSGNEGRSVDPEMEDGPLVSSDKDYKRWKNRTGERLKTRNRKRKWRWTRPRFTKRVPKSKVQEET